MGKHSHMGKQSFGNQMDTTLQCSEHPNSLHWEQHHAEITRAGRSVLPVFRTRAIVGSRRQRGSTAALLTPCTHICPRLSLHPPGAAFPLGLEKHFMR